jgi:hypothetical protein
MYRPSLFVHSSSSDLTVSDMRSAFCMVPCSYSLLDSTQDRASTLLHSDPESDPGS